MAASTSHEVPFSKLFSSSSSSPLKRWKYDVFVSFRGKDTRKGFTGHLYMALYGAGINVFSDDQLRRGTLITEELMQAIEGSKISLIVFSRCYGDSTWCLEELVEILRCRKRRGQTVLPIFYDVDPTDVRNQTGSFGEAFHQKHQDKYKYQIERWRDALTEAANLSGWELTNTANGHEAKFIKIVADQIKMYSVEIDSPLQDSDSCLRQNLTDDGRMIGTRGMGGASKTTNAKSIYNEMYGDYHSKVSFLETAMEPTRKHTDGALSEKHKEGKSEFTKDETVSEIPVETECKQIIAIPVSEDLSSYLREEITDVRVIGIRGMEGTGRTTNAKSIDNKFYQSKASFPENVMESAREHNEGALTKEHYEGECEFTTAVSFSKIVVESKSKHVIEIPVSEGEIAVWEVRVVGGKVIYAAEFVPSDEIGYTVILQKARKVAPSDEPVISNSFEISQAAGMVQLILDNRSFMKKKVLYRTRKTTNAKSIDNKFYQSKANFPENVMESAREHNEGALTKEHNEGECEFTTAVSFSKIVVKSKSKHIIEIPVSEGEIAVWEVRMVSGEVIYTAEFVPSDEIGYTVILQKARKVAPSDEPVISNSFEISQAAGMVQLILDNRSFMKKKVLYRFKTKASSDSKLVE